MKISLILQRTGKAATYALAVTAGWVLGVALKREALTGDQSLLRACSGLSAIIAVLTESMLPGYAIFAYVHVVIGQMCILLVIFLSSVIYAIQTGPYTYYITVFIMIAVTSTGRVLATRQITEVSTILGTYTIVLISVYLSIFNEVRVLRIPVDITGSICDILLKIYDNLSFIQKSLIDQIITFLKGLDLPTFPPGSAPTLATSVIVVTIPIQQGIFAGQDLQVELDGDSIGIYYSELLTRSLVNKLLWGYTNTDDAFIIGIIPAAVIVLVSIMTILVLIRAWLTPSLKQDFQNQFAELLDDTYEEVFSFLLSDRDGTDVINSLNDKLMNLNTNKAMFVAAETLENPLFSLGQFVLQETNHILTAYETFNRNCRKMIVILDMVNHRQALGPPERVLMKPAIVVEPLRDGGSIVSERSFYIETRFGTMRGDRHLKLPLNVDDDVLPEMRELLRQQSDVMKKYAFFAGCRKKSLKKSIEKLKFLNFYIAEQEYKDYAWESEKEFRRTRKDKLKENSGTLKNDENSSLTNCLRNVFISDLLILNQAIIDWCEASSKFNIKAPLFHLGVASFAGPIVFIVQSIIAPIYGIVKLFKTVQDQYWNLYLRLVLGLSICLIVVNGFDTKMLCYTTACGFPEGTSTEMIKIIVDSGLHTNNTGRWIALTFIITQYYALETCLARSVLRFIGVIIGLLPVYLTSLMNYDWEIALFIFGFSFFLMWIGAQPDRPWFGFEPTVQYAFQSCMFTFLVLQPDVNNNHNQMVEDIISRIVGTVVGILLSMLIAIIFRAPRASVDLQANARSILVELTAGFMSALYCDGELGLITARSKNSSRNMYSSDKESTSIMKIGTTNYEQLIYDSPRANDVIASLKTFYEKGGKESSSFYSPDYPGNIENLSKGLKSNAKSVSLFQKVKARGIKSNIKSWEIYLASAEQHLKYYNNIAQDMHHLSVGKLGIRSGIRNTHKHLRSMIAQARDALKCYEEIPDDLQEMEQVEELFEKIIEVLWQFAFSTNIDVPAQTVISHYKIYQAYAKYGAHIESRSWPVVNYISSIKLLKAHILALLQEFQYDNTSYKLRYFYNCPPRRAFSLSPFESDTERLRFTS